MKSKDIAIAAFVSLLLAALALLWFAPAGLRAAPDISLVTLTGEKVALRDLRGQPVLVTFWATTCPGCIKEIPHLVELHEELAPKGLRIIGVAMSYDPPNQVMNLVNKRELPYTIALDLDGSAAKAFDDVRLTPSSFLIAPDGRIVKHKIGEMDMQAVKNRILAMLGASGERG